MINTDNPRRRHNVTRQMATEAARQGMINDPQQRRAVIWYDNPRDGWAWDFEDSGWLGHCLDRPKTNKLVKV
jgi:hypothetical protein